MTAGAILETHYPATAFEEGCCSGFLIINCATGVSINTPLLPEVFLLIEGVVSFSVVTQRLDQVHLLFSPHKPSTEEILDKLNSQTSYLCLAHRVYVCPFLLYGIKLGITSCQSRLQHSLMNPPFHQYGRDNNSGPAK